jgi:hypothetical protein
VSSTTPPTENRKWRDAVKIMAVLVLLPVLLGLINLALEYRSGYFVQRDSAPSQPPPAPDVIVNSKPTEPAYVVLKSYWLSKEPTLLLTYSPRSEKSADVVKGTAVRVLRREKGTFHAFGADNSIDLFYVEIVSELDKGIKGYIPENRLELK